jgi:hypothetical protein
MPSQPTPSVGSNTFIPVRYEPRMEKTDADEAQTNAGLIDTIGKIQSTVYKDTGKAMRGVHAKGHGVLVGELRVLENLPAHLAQGLFSSARSYPVVMRFSTIPGDVLDDNVSVPRAVAIKVVGVTGERVAGSEGEVTQDFVLANGPVFAKAHPKDFLSTLKILAGTTDKVPALKKALSTVMRGAEKLVEGLGGQSSTLMTLGGYPEINILGDEFYSQVPILYGEYMAKIAVKPFSPGLRALAKAPLDLKGRPNGIREAVADFFRLNSGEWEIQAQLCTDLQTMPIEDASKQWPEDESPYVAVGRISIPAQVSWSEERVRVVEERMSFSPWHALAAHRPLGATMRVRRTVYASAARFRAENNKAPMTEPKTLSDLPS